jgi:hypothetical protein
VAAGLAFKAQETRGGQFPLLVRIAVSWLGDPSTRPPKTVAIGACNMRWANLASLEHFAMRWLPQLWCELGPRDLNNSSRRAVDCISSGRRSHNEACGAELPPELTAIPVSWSVGTNSR